MRNSPFKFILLLVLLGAGLFFLFRPFAYVIAIALIITVALVGLVYAVKGSSYMLRKFRIRNTIEGIIEDKIDLILKQVKKISSDAETITREIDDIDHQLDQGGHSKFAEEKLLRLKGEFEMESALNQHKLDFFHMTLKRLNELLSDQEVLRKISAQQSKLKEVRNESPDNSHVEESNLSTDKETIEELDYLTLRMENAVHIDEAQDIQKALINLYR